MKIKYLNLIALLISILSCKDKKEDPEPWKSLTEKYSRNLAAPRQFKHYHRYQFYSGNVDSTWYANDTTFSIEVMNDTTLKLFDETLNYISSYYMGITPDTNSEVVYSLKSRHKYFYIRYNYLKDSISIGKEDGGMGFSFGNYYYSE